MPECRMCLNDRELRQSHIIPEFFFRPVYDEKHRALAVARDSPSVQFLQKGLRDRLLCDDCEGKLGEIERRFSSYWRGEASIPDTITSGTYKMSTPDVQLYRRLLLSILWRAGESDREEFSKVALGPYAERIRRILLSESPLDADAYPILCTILVYPDTREVASSLIASPFRMRLDGAKGYFFVFGGCAWIFLVASSVPARARLFSMKASAEWEVLVAPVDSFAPLVRSMRDHFGLRDSSRRKDG